MALDCFYKMPYMRKSMILLATGQGRDGRQPMLAELVPKMAEKKNPDSARKAADGFAKGMWFTNAGDVKGSILDSALLKYNPTVAPEIGTYGRYPAVRITSRLQSPASKLIALQISTFDYHIVQQGIDYAGLSSKANSVWGKFHTRIDEVRQFLEGTEAPCFDFVFLDCRKYEKMAWRVMELVCVQAASVFSSDPQLREISEDASARIGDCRI